MNVSPTIAKVVIPATAPTVENPIMCDGWPSILPAHFRQVMRLDGTVNAERARSALIDAILRVQSELSDWLMEQNQKGRESSYEDWGGDEVAPVISFNNAIAGDPVIDEQPRRAHHYVGAVYCYAAARLNDRMANFDATHQGMNRADETLPSTHTLERDGIAHIRAIKGESAGDVELL